MRFKGDRPEVTREYLLKTYGNPLDGLAALALPEDPLQADAKVEYLAKLTSCDAKSVRRLMEKAAKDIKRYGRKPDPFAPPASLKST